MAEQIDIRRKANARQAGRALGLDPKQPRSMAAQMKAMGRESDILSLPSDPNIALPLQVMDTASPDFGKFYVMASYSGPGGPDIAR